MVSLKNENSGPGYKTAKPLVSIWHWKQKQSPGVIYKIKEAKCPCKCSRKKYWLKKEDQLRDYNNPSNGEQYKREVRD